MIIVKGFDISTTEGATAFLEGEGIDVEKFVNDEISILKKQKALKLAETNKILPEGFCKYCGGPCTRANLSYPEDDEY